MAIRKFEVIYGKKGIETKEVPFTGSWKTREPVKQEKPKTAPNPKPKPHKKPNPNPEQELQRQLGGRTGEVIKYCQANDILDLVSISQLVREAYLNEKKSEKYVQGRIEFAVKTILKK